MSRARGMSFAQASRLIGCEQGVDLIDCRNSRVLVNVDRVYVARRAIVEAPCLRPCVLPSAYGSRFKRVSTERISASGSRPSPTRPMYSNASLGESGCMNGPARTSRYNRESTLLDR